MVCVCISLCASVCVVVPMCLCVYSACVHAIVFLVFVHSNMFPYVYAYVDECMCMPACADQRECVSDCLPVPQPQQESCLSLNDAVN